MDVHVHMCVPPCASVCPCVHAYVPVCMRVSLYACSLVLVQKVAVSLHHEAHTESLHHEAHTVSLHHEAHLVGAAAYPWKRHQVCAHTACALWAMASHPLEASTAWVQSLICLQL